MVHFVELLHPLKHLAENLDSSNISVTFDLSLTMGVYEIYFFKKKLSVQEKDLQTIC